LLSDEEYEALSECAEKVEIAITRRRPPSGLAESLFGSFADSVFEYAPASESDR